MLSKTNDTLFPTLSKLQKETTTSGSYRIIDELLLLPPTYNEKQLADNFNNFFVTRIDKIMTELVPTETHPMDPKYIESSYETLLRLETFIEIDSEYMRTLIPSAPVKSCELDPRVPLPVSPPSSLAFQDHLMSIILLMWRALCHKRPEQWLGRIYPPPISHPSCLWFQDHLLTQETTTANMQSLPPVASSTGLSFQDHLPGATLPNRRPLSQETSKVTTHSFSSNVTSVCPAIHQV